MSEQTTQQLDGVEFAVVEVMGHNTYAGKVSVVTLGGSAFIRVDVPEVPAGESWEPARPAFTKFVGTGSIYAITPCDEEAALAAARGLRSHAVTVVRLPERRVLNAVVNLRADIDPDDDEEREGPDDAPEVF